MKSDRYQVSTTSIFPQHQPADVQDVTAKDTQKTSKYKEGHTVLGTVSPWNCLQGVLHAPILCQLQPLPPK